MFMVMIASVLVVAVPVAVIGTGLGATLLRLGRAGNGSRPGAAGR